MLTNSTFNCLGSVVWLEEDHYVAEDFLHVLHLLENKRNISFPHVSETLSYKVAQTKHLLG